MNNTFYSTRFSGANADQVKARDVKIMENILKVARSLIGLEDTGGSHAFAIAIAGQINVYGTQIAHSGAQQAVRDYTNHMFVFHKPGSDVDFVAHIEHYLEYAETLVTSGHDPD